MLAEKAGVGGSNAEGQVKVIQRLEQSDIASPDVLGKVTHALGIENVKQPPDAAEVPAVVAARRRVKKPSVVVDGQVCLAALMALGWEGWRFVSFHVPNDVSDDEEVDDALLKVAGVVDVFRHWGAAHEAASNWALKPAGADKKPEPPRYSAVKQIELARDIRKAAMTLRERGLELWLAESWIHQEEISEWVFTRTFSVAPRVAPTGDEAKGKVE